MNYSTYDTAEALAVSMYCSLNFRGQRFCRFRQVLGKRLCNPTVRYQRAYSGQMQGWKTTAERIGGMWFFFLQKMAQLAGQQDRHSACKKLYVGLLALDVL